MNPMLRVCMIVLLLPLLASGCSWRGVLTTLGIAGAAGAGAAAVYYAKGDLQAPLDSDLRKAHDASRRTLQDNGYTIERDSVDALNGSIDAYKGSKEGDDRTTVRIRTKRNKEDATDISIRVGVFGDEKLSRQLLREIEEKL